MELPIIIGAFLAGMLTFLAPCTLPLVPGYLGFISGASAEDLKNPETAAQAKRKIFINGLFYVIGFSAVFVVFGTLAGLAGQALAPYRVWLARIGGVFVILFGLFTLNVLKIPFLQAERHIIKTPAFLRRGAPGSSFALGSAFAFGWTPCVGPILGSILLLASTSNTAFQGAFLLTVFSAGLAVPFLLVAWGVGAATRYISRFSKYLSAVSIIGGLFLIGLGLLLLFNKTSLLISYGYRFFDFINYDRLLDYL